MLLSRDVIKARHVYPAGIRCGVCNAPNYNADDCGWWFATEPKEGKYVAMCNSCYANYGPTTGDR